MTDRHDIWHRLKDHEASPPHEIFGRLQQMLQTGDAVPAQTAGNPFERLQQHEVPPPADLHRQIEVRTGIKRASSGRTQWYLVAAACATLLVAGWLIYRSYTAKETNIAVARKTQQPGPSKAAVPVVTDTLNASGDTSGRLAGTTIADTHAPAPSGKGIRPAFSIDGQTIRVTDNDLLATFTSFTYPDVPAYLTRNTGKPLKIYIDQYTQLYVSKNMLDMIKVTYQVLPNGKPARKARKMKRRLDNWKEKDQKRFDKDNGANPLDPVDLAEFIFR